MAKPVDKIWQTAFGQAAGVVAYCALVASLMVNGNKLFKGIPEYFAPFLFLTLFSTSAFICAVITLYKPFVLFFKDKQPEKALKLVVYTAGWLLVSTLLILLTLFLTK